MVYSKTITITAQDLGRDVTLMFTFDPPPGNGLFKDYFPLAWRVAVYPAEGYQTADFTYSAQLMFNKVQVTNGNLVSPGTRTPIDPGQVSTLITSPPGSSSFVWKTPTNIGGDVAKAVNGTDSAQNIGVGFLNGNKAETTLYFNNVGVEYQVAAQIRARLRVYVTLDYQETQVIRAEIESITPILETNMADVSTPTNYNLTYNAMTATFKLTPA